MKPKLVDALRFLVHSKILLFSIIVTAPTGDTVGMVVVNLFYIV
jgi:hypothetical protein